MDLLQVTGLTKRFGGLTAVSDFDFCLEDGELVGLIGPNGAGKTTVFNLMTGILKPDQGSVVFCGEDLAGKPPHISANKGLVRTFQNIRLMSGMTVTENLRPAFHHRLHYSLIGSMLGTSDFNEAEAKIEDSIADILEKLGWPNMHTRTSGSSVRNSAEGGHSQSSVCKSNSVAAG